MKLTTTATAGDAPYAVFGVVAVIAKDVKVTVPPREPAAAAGLT